MTFLEKAKEIDVAEGRTPMEHTIISKNCPYDYGLDDRYVCNRVGQEKCFECWNREMPNTEPKEDGMPVIPQSEVDAYNQGHADGMAQGLNDAWELANKIAHYTKEGLLDRFGTIEIMIVFEEFTYQEALAKLKAYEDSKIEVGDVVFCKALTEFDDRANKENYGVVTGIYSDHYEILMKNGDTTGFKLKECKKTGKHLDISSILEQIGE